MNKPGQPNSSHNPSHSAGRANDPAPPAQTPKRAQQAKPGSPGSIDRVAPKPAVQSPPVGDERKSEPHAAKGDDDIMSQGRKPS